jgi:uncharacterized protein
MDKRLLTMLVCPLCKGELLYDEAGKELRCEQDKLAYPIEDNIPVMLVHRARSLVNEEK